MSERYEKLFSLPENLYAEGSPVLVAAGNLLKDTQTGKILAQLKLKNISRGTIKAARIVLSALDTLGKPLDSETEKEYLDLSVGQDEEFGQKTAIPLANASTRGYTVRVKQVIFADNSTWDGTDAAWEPLPAAESLLRKLGDEELIKQFQLKFGGKCEVFPREHKDLWLCACGIWNREPKCRGCGKENSALLSLDLPVLTAEKDARLAKEKAEQEAKEAAEKEAREKSAKKTKKLLSIAVPAVILLVTALLLITTVLIPNSNYSKAKELLDAGQYEEAIAAFEALNGYKDSQTQIGIAKEAKLEAENSAAYAEAEALFSAGKYSEAAKTWGTLGSYKDSAERATLAWKEKAERENAAAYAEAEALLNAGDFGAAFQAFQALGAYQDSADRADAIFQEHPALALQEAKIGDVIVFGTYEQDNNIANGKEPIEWLVLAKEDDRLLVISKYGLDSKQYNETDADVTWETCTLRKWLNGDFLNAAFSANERAIIQTTTVTANKIQSSDVNPGNDTQDKVFLLSIPEAKNYFSSDETRKCKPTEYAITGQGCTKYSMGTAEWWLRSSGIWLSTAAEIDMHGRISSVSRLNSSHGCAVRPALWIHLGA